MRHRTWIASAVAAVVSAYGLSAARGNDFLVHNASEISTAVGQSQPGDTITMANGTWTDQHITFSPSGTSAAGITLRAQTPGRVILNGTSTLNITGDYLTATGLQFNGGALTGGNIVSISSSAAYSRFTNSAIVDYNPADISTDYNWVRVDGMFNRVDHNFFSGQNHSGRTVEVQPQVGLATHDR